MEMPGHGGNAGSGGGGGGAKLGGDVDYSYLMTILVAE
jgi:hypothetical protein